MALPPSPLSPDYWMADLFRSKAACRGGVIRRSARDIEKFIGRACFEDELRRRGYQAVENAGQIVIFCNREAIRRLV
jgi:hypothetical protein